MGKIYLIGDGWGCESALKGLSKVYNDVICLSSLDDSIVNGIIIFSGYKPIVPLAFIEKNTCINVHYSLLPKYRGLHSTVWAILNDEDYLGLSIHIMNGFIDDGPILHQYKIANDRVRTSCQYMELFNEYVAQNLGAVISDYINGRINMIPNNKSEATWVGRRNYQDCRVDFNRDIKYQQCFFRALVAPYPLPYVIFGDEVLTVTEVDYHKENTDTHIGRILNIDNDGLWVKVRDGYLILKELRNQDNQIVPQEHFRIGQYFNDCVR